MPINRRIDYFQTVSMVTLLSYQVAAVSSQAGGNADRRTGHMTWQTDVKLGIEPLHWSVWRLDLQLHPIKKSFSEKSLFLKPDSDIFTVLKSTWSWTASCSGGAGKSEPVWFNWSAELRQSKRERRSKSQTQEDKPTFGLRVILQVCESIFVKWNLIEVKRNCSAEGLFGLLMDDEDEDNEDEDEEGLNCSFECSQ